MNSANDEVVFTSYSESEIKLTTLLKVKKKNPKHSYLPKVDATTFHKDFYDYVIWVGPRADPGDEKNYGTLVNSLFNEITESQTLRLGLEWRFI